MTRTVGARAERHRPAPPGARAVITTALAAMLFVHAGSARSEDARTAFRPCIDPNNLPFANTKGEGFENRIADLFAAKLNLPVQTYAFPQRMNFIRNTLRYRLPGEDFRCDVVMGVPAEFDQAWATQPYYRSTYALVYRKGTALDSVKSGADLFALPAATRERLRVGIYDKSPASLWLVKHGMEAQARPYAILSPDPDQSPGDIIVKDLAQDKVDAVVVWGPIAGYFAKRVPDLAVVPLTSEPGVKFDYAIAMGVRYGEGEWKKTIEGLIAENRGAIEAILREYGVPLVNERGEVIGKSVTQ